LIEWETSQPPPTSVPAGEDILWTVELIIDGVERHGPQVQVVDDEVFVGVWDLGESRFEQLPAEAAFVDGRTWSLSVPRSLIGQLPTTFEWKATIEGGSEALQDSCPGAPLDGEALTFPPG
jgi:hypothetical protein